MRNVMETTNVAPATVTIEAVRGGDLAVFPDANFFGSFSDGGQRALHETLSLAKDKLQEALMTTQVETMPASVSEWRMTIDIAEDGTVNVGRLFLSDMLAKAKDYEGLLYMMATALTVLLAKTVVFV